MVGVVRAPVHPSTVAPGGALCTFDSGDFDDVGVSFSMTTVGR